jgi:Domain of unknown function (DUF4760)
MRRRYWVYALVIAAAIAILVPLIKEAMGPNGQIWHAATFFGSILITVGWIVTSEINIGNSRRQHTITLITQHIVDHGRAINRDIVREYLPSYTTKLSESRCLKFSDENHRLLKAIDLELNFYEFVAAGVDRNDIEERLLRLCLRGQFCCFYEQCSDYIDHWRAKNANTWCHINRMYRRWSRPSLVARIRKTLAESILCGPPG